MQQISCIVIALAIWTAATVQTVLPQTTKPLRNAKADFLSANIDPTISPRDDFFQYANGGWFKRNPIPDDQGTWGIWNLGIEDVLLHQRRVSERAAARKAPKGSIEQLIGDFWYTGMDSTARNRRGIEPLRVELQLIEAIRSTVDLMDFVAGLHAMGARNAMFSSFVTQDEKASDRWIFTLWQGGFTMRSPLYYSANDGSTVKVREAFRQYLLNVFLRIGRGGSTAQARADAVYDLEAKLAKASYQGDGYEIKTVDEIQKLAPSIDWTRYLRSVGIADTVALNMAKPRFYQALDALVREVPIETWKDYLRTRVFTMNANFIDDEAFNIVFAYDRSYTGQLLPTSRWKRVIQVEGRALGEPLARLLEREYLPARVKRRYQTVAEAIRAAFRERIVRSEWMTDSTKKSALEKLSRLKVWIGYPDRPVNLSTMDLKRDSYVQNVQRAFTWRASREIKKLDTKVEKSEWQPSSTMNDASYEYGNNRIIVEPASVAVPGLPDEELDDAFVYGFTLLGHEMSHAFDSEGRQYDAFGNRVDWWTPTDAVSFNQRARRIIEEYDEFTPLDGLHIDGKRTLSENIADLAGVRVALDAFKHTAQYKRNRMIAGFTPLQRFFLAYACRHMNQARKENLVSEIRYGPHPPDRERVIGVLLNIPEFYEAFNIKLGDSMYRAENLRVSIW